jgi:predicted O-methyltransferase YrrM
MNVDEKVKKYLTTHSDQWSDWNIPQTDGKILYNLILEHDYTKALEIGTSTGLSAIWIAWAMSKTGGRLLTIEMFEVRYRKALHNFKEAGLSDYIDARLADAHQLIAELGGPFDFVFSDADKEWYKNYFVMLEPKIEVGGCYAAHNVLWDFNADIRAFLRYLQKLTHFDTRIEKSSSEGISISYKRKAK